MRELSNLEELQQKERIFVAPAGGAAERFIAGIKKYRPDIQVMGYLDSFKSTRTSGGDITRISEATVDEKAIKVVVVIEKEAIREKIIGTLVDNGINQIDWVDTHFSFIDENETGGAPSTLYYFYDLSVNTLNFEFIFSFARADAERKRLGMDKLHAVIVPQRTDSIFDFSRQSIQRTNEEANLECDNSWFLHNVIIPSVALMPSCSGFTLCGHRSEAMTLAKNHQDSCFPEKYDVNKPIELNSAINITNSDIYDGNGYGQPLVSSPASIGFVRQWFSSQGIDPGKSVVITLRKYGLEQERNSNQDAWICFANRVKQQGYTPIFVKDTYADFDPDELSDHHIFHVAAWNLQLRMALYEVAFMNMTVNTGPFTLCMFNKNVRYLNFVFVSEDSYAGSVVYHESMGTPVGSQYPAHTPLQRWVWGGGDDCDKIMAEFNAMCETIELTG